ncbi:uncharacterized protein LOC132204543 isoform X2 [Neocloeon triangulifer]|uniref:uncharacterized protein LOC132204543 isoform X2 n=1 Tax=Neocloeon triangulifer TaxID=2078957 RepID=UPI00286EC903|nr:uncharacterized protein LOC132204543 isoform X2 [Neocloeon triangulifer]
MQCLILLVIFPIQILALDSSTATTAAGSTTTGPFTDEKSILNQQNNCSAKNYAKVFECCANPPTSLVLFNRFENYYYCKITKEDLHAFNVFSLNKQQHFSNSPANSIAFQSKKVKTALGRHACFVNCYLMQKGSMSPDLTINQTALTDFLIAAQTDEFWKSTISAAIAECISVVKVRSSCSGKAFVIVQCVLFKMITKCPKRVESISCTKTYSLFDRCSANVFAKP